MDKNIKKVAQEVRAMYERDVLEIRRAVVTAQAYYNMYQRTGKRKYAFACAAECRKARDVMEREEAVQTKLYDDVQWLGPRGLIVAMGYRRVVYPHIVFLQDAEEVIRDLETRTFFARATGRRRRITASGEMNRKVEENNMKIKSINKPVKHGLKPLLINCWGEETNDFANPDYAHNGGGYFNPAGGAVWATSTVGDLIVGCDDMNCGDFGARWSVTVTIAATGRTFDVALDEVDGDGDTAEMWRCNMAVARAFTAATRLNLWDVVDGSRAAVKWAARWSGYSVSERKRRYMGGKIGNALLAGKITWQQHEALCEKLDRLYAE